MTNRLRTHGVLITFRRPDTLAEHLASLEAQTFPLTTLLVVDNDDDPKTQAILDSYPGAAGAISYLGVSNNPGPAGGIAAGITEVLKDKPDEDWLVLLDDNDPPFTDDTLEVLATAADQLSRRHEDVGGVGIWGAHLERGGRLRAATGDTPEQVAYLPGGAIPHYQIAQLRKAGGPDPSLFFGFDDLDLGLAFERVGSTLFSGGFARELGRVAMVENRTVSASVSPATWRRYYSLRNLIIVLRRNDRAGAALSMSLLAGIAKPLANLPVQPRLACKNLRLNALALSHGWRMQSGKSFDPVGLPEWLK